MTNANHEYKIGDKLRPANGTRLMRLADIATLSTGGSRPDDCIKGQLEPTVTHPYPVYSNGVGDRALYGYSGSYKIDQRAVTLTARGTIGYHAVRAEKFTPIISLITMIPNTDIITADFLNYALSQVEIPSTARGTAIRQTTLSMIRDLEIVVPPLGIQQQIVNILDQYEQATNNITAALTKETILRERQLKGYREMLLKYNPTPAQPNTKSYQLGDELSLNNQTSLVTLSTVAHYPKGRVDVNTLNLNNYIGVENLLKNRRGKTTANNLPPVDRVPEFKTGDILIGNIRPYLKKIWLANHDGGASGDVVIIRSNNPSQLLPNYLYHVLAADSFFERMMRDAKTGKMPRGDKKLILNYEIPLPPINIQQQIANTLDQLEPKIHQLTNLLPKEIKLRQKQYKYYRDLLLDFKTSVNVESPSP